MNKFNEGDLVVGKVVYATVVPDYKGNLKFEIGVEVTGRLVGDKVEDGIENVSPFEAITQLFVQPGDDEPSKQKRSIARDQINKLTGEAELEDSWETDGGYLRLTPDHPESLLPKVIDKEVILKAREYGSKVYWNLHFPRQRPKTRTLAELKAKLKEKQEDSQAF